MEDCSKAASFRLRKDFDIIARMMEEVKADIQAAMRELDTKLPKLDLSDVNATIQALADRQAKMLQLMNRVRELVADIERLKVAVKCLVKLSSANSHLLHEHLFAAQRSMRDQCNSFKKLVDEDAAQTGKLLHTVTWTRKNYCRGMVNIKLNEIGTHLNNPQVNNDTKIPICTEKESEDQLSLSNPNSSGIHQSAYPQSFFQNVRPLDKRRLRRYQPPMASIAEDDIPSGRQSMISLKSKLSSSISLCKLSLIDRS